MPENRTEEKGMVSLQSNKQIALDSLCLHLGLHEIERYSREAGRRTGENVLVLSCSLVIGSSYWTNTGRRIR